MGVRTDVYAALQVLQRPGAVIELRIFHRDHVQVGHYDNLQAVAHDACWTKNERASAVYYSLNAYDPAKLDRDTKNRSYLTRDAGREQDFVERVSFLIDVDPDRDSGTNSTDVEKAAAWVVAQRAIQFLSALDWPLPIIVDSGNGFHLHYRMVRGIRYGLL